MMKLSDRLIALKKGHNELSFEKIGKILGYSTTHTGDMFKGKRNINLTTLKALCQIFNLTPCEMLEGTEYDPRVNFKELPPALQEIQDGPFALSPDQINFLKVLVYQGRRPATPKLYLQALFLLDLDKWE